MDDSKGMQLRILGSRGLPEGSLVSVRVGATRRQATLGSDKAYFFPEATGMQAMKIDIYAPVASTRLNIDPADKTFTLPLFPSVLGGCQPPNMNESTNGAMSIEVNVGGPSHDALNHQVEAPIIESFKGDHDSRPATASTRPCTASTARGSGRSRGPSQPRHRHHVALEAQPYFEKHCIGDVVQSMLQAVIQEKPLDPLPYMIGVLENTCKGVTANVDEGDSTSRGQQFPKAESILQQHGEQGGNLWGQGEPREPPRRARPRSARPCARKPSGAAVVPVEQMPLAQDSAGDQAASDSTRSPSCAAVNEDSLPSAENTLQATLSGLDGLHGFEATLEGGAGAAKERPLDHDCPSVPSLAGEANATLEPSGRSPTSARQWLAACKTQVSGDADGLPANQVVAPGPAAKQVPSRSGAPCEPGFLPPPGTATLCPSGVFSPESDACETGTTVSQAHREVVASAAEMLERDLLGPFASMQPAFSEPPSEPSLVQSTAVECPLLLPDPDVMGARPICMDSLRKRMRDGLEAAADAGTLSNLICS